MPRLSTRDRTHETRPRTRPLCAAVLLPAIAAVLLGLAALPSVAQAQGAPQLPAPGPGPNDTNEHAWNKFMRTLGISSSPDAASDINYTERAPLVIPPSRDLPQPATDPARPTTDWPNDTRKQGRRQKPKDAVIPDTAVATPNPPINKKPWYDPSGWFDKEEYANFKGEPVREDLTDPPTGYRVPSPDQPYGVNPNKKPHPVASQANPVPGAAPAGTQPPTGAQPAAPPQASDQPAAAPQAPGAQSASTQPANAQSPR